MNQQLFNVFNHRSSVMSGKENTHRSNALAKWKARLLDERLEACCLCWVAGSGWRTVLNPSPGRKNSYFQFMSYHECF